jgi:hypothetical protein
LPQAALPGALRLTSQKPLLTCNNTGLASSVGNARRRIEEDSHPVDELVYRQRLRGLQSARVWW